MDAQMAEMVALHKQETQAFNAMFLLSVEMLAKAIGGCALGPGALSPHPHTLISGH